MALQDCSTYVRAELGEMVHACDLSIVEAETGKVKGSKPTWPT